MSLSRTIGPLLLLQLVQNRLVSIDGRLLGLCKFQNPFLVSKSQNMKCNLQIEVRKVEEMDYGINYDNDR